MAEMEERDRQEEVGPVGAAAEDCREPHEPQAEPGDERNLEQHPGAEIVREAEFRKVEQPRKRQAVFVVLRP